MMNKIERETKVIHETVRKAYAARAKGGGCCGPTAAQIDTGSASDHRDSALKMGYSAEDLDSVPEEANLGLGCGAPLEAAGVKAGETVLDLGSGAGFDAFIAARFTGPEGHVIGVDMTAEMIRKARENALHMGAENVEFRQGLIENLPVEDGTVDVIVSNCVINLSPDKPAVFREAFRVLRPGGRMAVSDIVLTTPLPATIAENMAAYVGCVAGASLLDDYLRDLAEAGFEDIEVEESHPAVETLSEDDPIVRSVLEGAGACCVRDLSEDIRNVASTVISAKITARKPEMPS